MDVKQECQKLYDNALLVVKATAEGRKIPEQDVMNSFGFFDQFKPGLADLRLKLGEDPGYRTNYKSRKSQVIVKYGSSANEELFQKKFMEAVKAKDFTLFYGFVENCFL